MRRVDGVMLSVCLLLGLPRRATAQDTRSTGQFDLMVRKSAFLPIGATHLETSSASVTYTSEFFGGTRKALKIQMVADSRRGSATLVLFVDEQQRITQANLTYVVPGATVARTIASTPDEIAKYFPRYRYANGRLRLTSRGTYASHDSADESFILSWRLEVDTPVIVRP